MAFLERNANSGSVSTGYDIDNSAAFGGANGIQFNPSSDGNRKTWTMSLWVKRSEIGVETTIFGATNTAMVFMDPDWFRFHLYTGSANYYYDTDNTNTVFRDTSAWYHFVFQCDTTQGTAANRTKLYINGALYTGARGGADTSANIPQNTEFDINHNTQNFNLGYFYAGNEQLDGYLADVHFTDGVANDADAFGEYDEDSGIWVPKAYAGAYGTNGFYLEFKEPAASATGIGKDTSGNGHNFSTGGAYPSQATDTPTNNFCTFNAVNMYGSTASLAQGATFTASTANGAFTTYGTMAPSAGKWWWEGKIQVFADTAYACIGATTNLAGLPSVSAQLSGGHVIKLSKAQKWVLNDTGYNYGTAYSDGEYINVGLDLDNRKFYTYRNGTIDDANGIDISSSTFDGFGSQWMPLVITYGSGGASSYEINFGGHRTYSIGSPQSDANGYGTFEYEPPSGFYALCTKNLAEYG